jgi:hypothetical protein
VRLFALVLMVLLPSACTGTSGTGGISPITGILVRSESLVSGRGCGEGATALFRYAAVVTDEGGTPLVGGAYDCFADAGFTFGNLRPNGATKYKVFVFAFNRTAFDAQRSSVDGAGANLGALRALRPTWTTTCEATPLPDVQVLAVCPALKAEGAGSAAFRTASFPRAAGGPDLLCGGDFAKVRATVALVGRTLEVDCPSTVQVVDLPAPAEVAFDVELVAAAGGGVTHKGRCTAKTSNGLEAPVVCKGFSPP